MFSTDNFPAAHIANIIPTSPKHSLLLRACDTLRAQKIADVYTDVHYCEITRRLESRCELVFNQRMNIIQAHAHLSSICFNFRMYRAVSISSVRHVNSVHPSAWRMYLAGQSGRNAHGRNVYVSSVASEMSSSSSNILKRIKSECMKNEQIQNRSKIARTNHIRPFTEWSQWMT